MEKKILVIDDDVALVESLRDKLASLGYNVDAAYDGDEGLSKALENHPDLVLLDIRMPKMNGWEVFEALGKDEWGKSAKVIMLTNADDMEDVSKAVTHHTKEYLIKGSWTLEDLSQKVKNTLAS